MFIPIHYPNVALLSIIIHQSIQTCGGSLRELYIGVEVGHAVINGSHHGDDGAVMGDAAEVAHEIYIYILSTHEKNVTLITKLSLNRIGPINEILWEK